MTDEKKEIVKEEVKSLNENYKDTMTSREKHIAILVGEACYDRGKEQWESEMRIDEAKRIFTTLDRLPQFRASRHYQNLKKKYSMYWKEAKGKKVHL